MKHIQNHELREELIPLHPDITISPTGGEICTWQRATPVWGKVMPLEGEEGFRTHTPGGGMAPGQGALKTLPAARYKVFIPTTSITQPPFRLIWLLNTGERHLLVTRQPLLIQRQRYLKFYTVETNNDYA